MSTPLRIASFNLENLDDKPGQTPTLQERIELMRPQLERLDADVLCLQEVNGQEVAGAPREFLALDQLVAATQYENYERAFTHLTGSKEPYDERNLVILSKFRILEFAQYRNTYAKPPQYRAVTADPPPAQATDVAWERPILHARLKLDATETLHVINVHYKSRLPSNVDGQRLNTYTWKTSSGWAEGAFISAIKRVGQALETRILIDKLFDADANAKLVVCGDFNADIDDVPLEALRGDVENTENPALAKRTLVPCEFSIPESARYTLYHHGRGNMLDHILASRSLVPFYKGTEIHNEILHDESAAFATDKKFPESDHAPLVAHFDLP